MTAEIENILKSAKALAKKYKKITGKPLGITGEIAEVSAARLLNLNLVAARQAGYDALDKKGNKIQIKGRCLTENPKPGQRLGSIKPKHDWDSVLMVLLDESYEVMEIWESGRRKVLAALRAPGSKARNQRGALSISKFKQIGERVWPKG